MTFTWLTLFSDDTSYTWRSWEAFRRMALVQLTCGIATRLSVIRRTRNAAAGINLANNKLMLMISSLYHFCSRSTKVSLRKVSENVT